VCGMCELPVRAIHCRRHHSQLRDTYALSKTVHASRDQTPAGSHIRLSGVGSAIISIPRGVATDRHRNLLQRVSKIAVAVAVSL